MYTAEGYEVERYTKAVQDYQSLGTRIQASLSFLNSSQQAIVYATLVGKKAFMVASRETAAEGEGFGRSAVSLFFSPYVLSS